ncbi:sec-independent translocation protein mttA/Hcf106 [Pirellula staleyi DSM 6068]|uniref:Sec-independent protein translocase protein TatA n=1 Tax=Pirellula staleyi (strain ATCC 27377 / DSM 6068 / ICPB 4128) TaxID=530564 RepID=D2R7C1_PIRSD|nr:twin-arginine translocase TatA/TatE family subunit [Pirellula staleyi]ADB15617.1 sec-independent translocation protein mttA/Hcf106 [Pirellula staleyi DSM 6068]
MFQANHLQLFGIFGIGQFELIVVGVIILILFGHRLPTMMFSLGKGIKDFKKGINSTEEDEPAPADTTSKKSDS